jgi:hypothetical protein
MIPFIGFLPDADEHLQGVITDCEMMLPTMKGYKGAPSFVSATDALSAACRGAAYVLKLDNSTRLFAGTQTKLYELAGTSWNDVSKVGDYVGSGDSVWRFAQFGDVSLAVNGTDAFQYSNGSGAFADLSGAPKAAVIETVQGFVMVGNYNDGSSVPDGIYWSAYLDYSDWTPDVATQSGNLRLLDTPGEVRGLKRLGQYAIAYKEQSMYLGVNNGPPVLWGFTFVSGEIGAVSHESIVSIETAHFFISRTDIFMFDGARPVPIGEGVREWFFNDLNSDYAFKIRGFHDKNTAQILWYYPSTSSTGELDSCIVYNYRTRKWGRANRTIEACLEYLTGALTYAGLEAAYTTYDTIPSVSYGSPFWTTSTPNSAVFDSSHVLGTLNGASLTSSITTGAVGDDVQMTMVSRVQPRFLNDPTSGSMTNYYRMTDGAAYTTDATSTISNARFDVLREARWHKFKLDFTGDVELNGNSYVLVPAGYE